MKQQVLQIAFLALKWLAAGGAAILLSAFARALPPPKPEERLYLFFYNWAHFLLANPDKVIK